MATYCGLPAWDDAPEGLDASGAWALFDVEKFARMLLRQSVAAYETLTAGSGELLDVRAKLATDALSQTITTNLCDAAVTAASMGNEKRARILLASAVHLSTNAIATLDPKVLQTEVPGVFGCESDLLHARIETTRGDLSTKNVLPPAPSGYHRVSDWVVATRMDTLGT